jgi:hypothetical protein
MFLILFFILLLPDQVDPSEEDPLHLLLSKSIGPYITPFFTYR